MSEYALTWITDQLAVGHAPMSYEELKSIRTQGISAIVNLCGEYCDLHEIERKYGFEVLYLPVADDEAPELEEIERALAWMDEAIYLGKRVLVHCRLGIGRTGTFVTSYLLRRGFGLKLAQKRLKNIRSSPTSFSQWWLLRKYGKRAGRLNIREPSLEGSRLVDLNPYFDEYERVIGVAEDAFASTVSRSPGLTSCGRDNDDCCGRFLHLQFIEAAYLSHYLNRILSREDRLAAIQRAAAMSRAFSIQVRGETAKLIPSLDPSRERTGAGNVRSEEASYRCPLSVEGKCIAYPYRPLVCRVYGMPLIYKGEMEAAGWEAAQRIEEAQPFQLDLANRTLFEISRRLFFALNGTFLEGKSLLFPLTHVVSGKFVQDYFALLARMGKEENGP